MIEFVAFLSYNIRWKVKRFSRCLLRYRDSSSAHWTRAIFLLKVKAFFRLPLWVRTIRKSIIMKCRRKFWNTSLKPILTKLEKLNTKVLSLFLRINYIQKRGSLLLSIGYYLETKSPLARMMRNCRRWLKLIGVNNLSDVLTVNYLQAGCYSQVRYWTL